MTSERETVSPIDHAWLRMDSETNAMVITALMIFDEAPGFAAFRDFVRERLLVVPRFRQRAVASRIPLAAPHWEIDPKFDLESHLFHVALPDPGGDLELSALVSDLVGTELSHARPLWQLHYVEGYGPGAAVVARVHHAVGDGVALVRMLLDICEEPLSGAIEVGLQQPHPHGAVELAKLAGAHAATLGRLLLLPMDPKTPLRGTLGRRKHAVFSKRFALEPIKRAARRAGGKTNDVLLAAISGGLRQHLVAQGTDVDGLELRAMVPVYVKAKGAGGKLGNHFGLVYIALPIGIADREERLHELVQHTEAMKAAPDAVVSLEVLAALGAATGELEQVALELFTRKASVMITNIPGPRGRIEIAGKPLSSMVVWAPVSGQLGIGISAVSYAGEARLALAVDAGLIHEPEALLELMGRELEAFAPDAVVAAKGVPAADSVAFQPTHP